MSDQTQEIVIAYCGLVCSNCGSYLKGKCQGCHSDKPMNRNCKIKACAMDFEYTTCAECVEFADLKECKKLNNLISKFFGLVFGSDRVGGLNHIREIGLDAYAVEKAASGEM